MKAGAEAAIHSMRDIFTQQNTDADAVIRVAMLKMLLTKLGNSLITCPSPFAAVLINTYEIPTRLFISSVEGR